MLLKRLFNIDSSFYATSGWVTNFWITNIVNGSNAYVISLNIHFMLSETLVE